MSVFRGVIAAYNNSVITLQLVYKLFRNVHCGLFFSSCQNLIRTLIATSILKKFCQQSFSISEQDKVTAVADFCARKTSLGTLPLTGKFCKTALGYCNKKTKKNKQSNKIPEPFVSSFFIQGPKGTEQSPSTHCELPASPQNTVTVSKLPVVNSFLYLLPLTPFANTACYLLLAVNGV